MSVQIRQVTTKGDYKSFIYLPEKIHHAHPNWVHPLYIDEEAFFNPDKNPAFQKNPNILFLAYRDNILVGRIMGIIPTGFNQSNQSKDARFSYFECYDDREVFEALLKAVESWAIEQGSDQLIGPLGFSDKEPQGFVTMGHNEKSMLVTNCNFKYMVDFIEEQRFEAFVKLCQYDVPLTEKIIHRYLPFAERVKRNLQVKVHEFNKSSEIKPYVQKVFQLINKTYNKIYGFSETTEKEADEFARRFLPLLNPRLIKLITDENDDVVAFIIGMPDLSNGIRKAKGRLLPLGWMHIWKASRRSKRLVLLLGAVKNEYQNKGLDAVLAVTLIGSALDLGFTMMDSHLIMKDNIKMRREIERLENFRQYKEYSIFRKSLG